MATQQIPGPRGKLLIGNLLDVDPENATHSMHLLHQQYGPIIQLQMLNKPPIIALGSQEYVHEVCDTERFEKLVGASLREVRNLAGNGLFTAFNDEPEWGMAHRILLPAFGPLGIKGMFPGMADIASQLLSKWERFGDSPIDVVADFTKLAFDTIALCTFSHRFNSFYTEGMPPFVRAMGESLKQSGYRTRRIPGTDWMHKAEDAKYREDIALLHHVADDLIAKRRSGEEKASGEDLLDKMLNGRDPKTGQGLSDENIRYQMVTFLIAGHETTSGLLSFLFYYLMRTPSAYQAIQKEVDTVCGIKPIEFEHLNKLVYIDAALKEALRLRAPAPAFGVTPKKDTETLGGKYTVKKGQFIAVVLESLHRDPAVWGEDAEEFRPERMLNGGFENLPKDSWKPFGNGMRACIGRSFAWQEALLAVASIFQKFDVRPHDRQYDLVIKTSLTIKPDGLFMHVSPRKDHVVEVSTGKVAPNQADGTTANAATNASSGGKPLTILYGSNAGTCKTFAITLQNEAAGRGFAAELKTLNAASSGKLPTDRPVAIITASYEGQPTDDAAFFVEWLKSAPGTAATGVQYGVFGCGHPDWVSTFHAVPKLIDERLTACGGSRLLPRGEGNVSSSELFDQFNDWKKAFLVAINGGRDAGGDAEPAIEVKIDSSIRQNLLHHEFLRSAVVTSNKVISKGGTDIKRQIELELPEDAYYRTGDYLGILPVAPHPTVMRVLHRFNLHGDDLLTVKAVSATSHYLPVNTPVSAYDLFKGFFELDTPISSRQLAGLVKHASDERTKAALERYAQPEVFAEEIAKKRVSLLAVLEEFPKIKYPLSEFILAVPAIHMRQYSISSTPMLDPHKASLTIAVIDAPHISGRGSQYLGIASHFLATLEPGTRIRAAVRPSSAGFHPPNDPKVPIILIASGSGIAPFRAFVHERYLQKICGREVGPALFFYGCRSPEEDALYDDEFAEFAKAGVVSVRYAFSRAPEQSFECKYVQDRVAHDGQEMIKLFRDGAKTYLCGSKRMSEGITTVLKQLYMGQTGATEEAASQWIDENRAERFATDVFG